MEEKKVPHIFEAGKGVNLVKLNADFKYVQDSANSNESKLTDIDSKALRKDGANIEQDLVNKFHQEEPVLLENKRGDIVLTDNKTHFLSLVGAGNIVLPNVLTDQFSHTIVLIVQGGDYSLYVGTDKKIYSYDEIDTTKTYSVLYIWNKIDKSWYSSITQ